MTRAEFRSEIPPYEEEITCDLQVERPRPAPPKPQRPPMQRLAIGGWRYGQKREPVVRDEFENIVHRVVGSDATATPTAQQEIQILNELIAWLESRRLRRVDG